MFNSKSRRGPFRHRCWHTSLAHLPSYPGYEWRVYGSDLVLVAVATAVIADVLSDVFR